MRRSVVFTVLGLVLVPATLVLANVLNHRVPLKHVPGEVLVVEGEDGRSLSMYHGRYGSFAVEMDEQGSPTEHVAVLGPIHHWDLNGDGFIDGRYNSDNNEAHIWMDDAWVQVMTTKDGFRSRTKRASESDVVYTFRDGAWHAR